MMGRWMDRRKLMIVGATVLLAGCQIVPKGPGPTTTGPGPDLSGLPDDEGRHRVALLVPLSGSNAGVGQSIANATTMALLDTNASDLRITTYDTGSGTRSAAARAIADGNRLILGPLLSENTGDVLSQARPAGVPLISFSNDVTSAARDVFVMGHIPEQSISRTVSYASSKGVKRFAALIPDGEYGKRAELALSQAVLENSGSLMATEKYPRGGSGIVTAAQKLESKGGFEALLIADGSRLAAIGASQFEGTNKPKILGTELWSGESSAANQKSLQGAWFSAVSDGRYGQFVKSYKSRFGGQPYRIATLGYDAVLLTLRIARNWKPGRSFPTSQMTDDGGFIGLDGPFRFKSSGIVERAMEVREVRNGTITVVSAAPARFDD